MADARTARAFAKVNLSLRVRSPDASGYHPLRSLAQSVDWADDLELAEAEDDELVVTGAQLPAGEDNLAWRAVLAVRNDTAVRKPVRLALDKRIAVAAGLGGGSADAAAALVLATEVFAAGDGTAERLAPGLGADVPFCLVGGLAWLEGRGERISPVDGWAADFALAIVVPPFELATAAVYEMWDRLEGPLGDEIDGRDLPPSLRRHGPFANDLLPAALRLAPDLGDWRADLARRWTRPVSLSGSGPALFAYFIDRDEAEDAVRVTPGARAAVAAEPCARGTELGSGNIG